MAELYRALREYCGSDYYPFHMPGHKRRLGGMADPLSFDITEIDGFDNLHHPEGILLEAQQRAAALYGGEETYFLVNGSTAGILCAIGACAPSGKILMARNSHKAAYHAVYLNRLEAVYLYPEPFGPDGADLGLNGPVLAKDVERALRNQPDIRAVFITSPTYDGVCSDVAAIADVAHRAGIPLIVDAAHGAHFGMHPMFPENGVNQGADLVIHSLHKTLPSPTQTALLHVNGPLADRRRLRKLLGIYQTSSPSYVLMAGIDQCILMLEKQGKSLFEAFAGKLVWLRDRLRNLKALRLIETDDPSKVLIGVGTSGLSGLEIGRILREAYHLELEMTAPGYALALTSVGDDWGGIRRLAAALLELDGSLSLPEKNRVEKPAGPKAAKGQKHPGDGQENGGAASGWETLPPGQIAMTIAQAEESPQERVALAESRGRICGEYLYRYPPGVPLVVPGERIGEELLARIRQEQRLGCSLHGPEDHELKMLWVIRE